MINDGFKYKDITDYFIIMKNVETLQNALCKGGGGEIYVNINKFMSIKYIMAEKPKMVKASEVVI